MNSKKYNGITLMKHENTSLSPGTKVISDYIYIGTFIYTYFAYIYMHLPRQLFCVAGVILGKCSNKELYML